MEEAEAVAWTTRVSSSASSDVAEHDEVMYCQEVEVCVSEVMGLVGVELMEWSNWRLGCVGARPPGALTLLTAVTAWGDLLG